MSDSLRASQLLSPFGPGAMIDLPDRAVVVAGLQGWIYREAATIEEPRLQVKLRQLLQRPVKLRFPPLPAEQSWREPGHFGVVGYRFPNWFIADWAQPIGPWQRRPLVHFTALEKNGREWRDPDKRKKHRVTPVRFVQGCLNGHLSDVDWRWFVHGGKPDHGARPLWIEEHGTSGDLKDIWIACDCGAAREIATALAHGGEAGEAVGALGRCNGHRPWLGENAAEECEEAARLLIRSASNAWFGEIMSAISIPDVQNPVQEAVRGLWEDGLKNVAEPADLAAMKRLVDAVRDGLAGLDDAEVLAAIQVVREDHAALAAGQSIKAAEFEALSQPAISQRSASSRDLFEAEAFVPAQPWPDWMGPVSQVVLVHRLRQVSALVGFTRFISRGPDTDGELDPELQRAPLSAGPADWVPAIENRGEGIFVQFDGSQIDAWKNRASVIARQERHQQAYEKWRQEHHLPDGSEAPPITWYLIHSISHLLMAAIALDCGYPSSSLAERVYAEEGKYGILILTASAGWSRRAGGSTSISPGPSRWARSAPTIRFVPPMNPAIRSTSSSSARPATAASWPPRRAANSSTTTSTAPW